MISAALRQRWTAVVQRTTERAHREYGHTELHASFDGARVSIVALVHRLGLELADRLRRAAPRGSSPSFDVAIAPASAWHRLHAPIVLLDRPPFVAPGELATELMPSDGPVGVLFEHEHARLVRATDGTVGWTRAALGERVPAPRLRQVTGIDGAAWVAAARNMLGRDYRWGGTTPGGLDCSGLVQRSARTCGLVLPRHSRDQLAVRPMPGEGPDRPGTLVFVWSEGEAAGHVMLATGDRSFVHASRSRGCVVEDARTERLEAARRCMHVPLEGLEAFARRTDGATTLADAMVIGRRWPIAERRTND